jgi:diketogulonate reductase-like aldo/keto reductase
MIRASCASTKAASSAIDAEVSTTTTMSTTTSGAIPQLSIRYDLELGLLPLPKTGNPAHMKSNAEVDFEISDEDMETLKNLPQIEDYGEATRMPVFSGKLS